MFYLILKEKVIDKSAAIYRVSPDCQWVKDSNDYPLGTGYVNGQFVTRVIPLPTPKEIRESLYPVRNDILMAVIKGIGTNDNADALALWAQIGAINRQHPDE